MSNPFSEYCPKCDANHAAGDCLAWLRKQYHDLRSRLSAAEEELQGWKNGRKKQPIINCPPTPPHDQS